MAEKTNVKEICIKIIPHTKQRYDTLGDYWWSDEKNGIMQVRISKQKNWRDAWAFLVHELIELGIVLHKGISIDDIDKFDMAYKTGSPGKDPKAPYHKEHMFACKIEKMFCKQVNRKWIAE